MLLNKEANRTLSFSCPQNISCDNTQTTSTE